MNICKIAVLKNLFFKGSPPLEKEVNLSPCPAVSTGFVCISQAMARGKSEGQPESWMRRENLGGAYAKQPHHKENKTRDRVRMPEKVRCGIYYEEMIMGEDYYPP